MTVNKDKNTSAVSGEGTLIFVAPGKDPKSNTRKNRESSQSSSSTCQRSKDIVECAI